MSKRGRPTIYKTEEERRKAKNQWSVDNYHKVKDRRAEKIRCECGAMVSRAYISDHKKKAKHKEALDFINSLKNEKPETCIIIQK